VSSIRRLPVQRGSSGIYLLQASIVVEFF
jgi:hypothetical protein